MKTGTHDKNFDLVSCLFHALQAVTACHSYIADAEAESDDAAREFFQHALEVNRELAEKGKELLHERLMSEEIAPARDDEKVHRESEMSFPASDPPSH